MKIDLRKLMPANELRGESTEETAELEKMRSEATAYITAFSWCSGVRECFFAGGVGRVIALFLFRIVPGPDDFDEWVWVVVGDLPPAYLAGQDAPTPADALEDYIWAMKQWVEAVKKGEPVDDLIPVNVAANLENATHLQNRLQFLEEHILPRFSDIAETPEAE